jgi:hypothetical protein
LEGFVNDLPISPHVPVQLKALLHPQLKILLIGAVTSAIALGLRYGVVEPESVAATCLADGARGWCWVRHALVVGFSRNLFALASLIAGIFATATRARWLAVIAIVLGVMGSILYRFELAGVGLLLGALVFARADIEGYQHTRSKQQSERIPS